MKKTTIHHLCALALAALCTLPAVAQLNGTGFYRFRNAQYASDYISMANDKFNFHTCISKACGGLRQALTDAGKARALDCAGKYLQTDIHMVDDANIIIPGSVIYAKKITSDGEYNLIGQGTSLETLTTGKYSASADLEFKERYITITARSGSGANTLYTASVELKSSTSVPLFGYPSLGIRYLVDQDNTLALSTSYSATNAKWYIEPVTHFNVLPEVELNGKWYTTLKVPFAFTLSGSVEKAFAITANSAGVLLYQEITGTVPAGTPVLLQCGSPNPTDCRLIPTGAPTYTAPQMLVNSDAPLADENSSYQGTNLLGGTYYCNTDGTITYNTNGGTDTINANKFTSASGKYVIGKNAEGKLGFIPAANAGLTYMPANKAWLTSAGVFPTVAAPSISLASGTYSGPQTVTISAQEGASILYSTDGGTTWQPYSGAIEVGEGTTTLQAKAIKQGLFNDSETVSATYVVEIANPVLSMTPESMTISDAAAGVFTITGTDIQGSINVGLASNSDWYLNPETLSNTGGEVNVTYTGRALTAQNTVNAYAANNAEVTASAMVNYKADIYVVTDNGVKDNWNFNNGSMMTEEDGIYTATFTATVPNTFILFARKLGDGVDWNTRYVFGPNSEDDWVMPANMAEYGGTIDVDDDDPVKLPYAGEYTITINANDYTFKIERLADPVLRGDVNSDGEVDIRDVTALIDYLLDETTVINQANADVDDKQGISITDVTALIDILLDN